jgi:Flp pilus assembly protein TadD
MAANPADAASLWALKLYRFALADEVPLEHDLGFEREAVPVLCTFFVPFSLLLAGGLLGAALRRDRGARLCALALAVHAATSIVFYVASRYRAPAAPALAVLAAVGAVALLERWRAGHRRSAAGLALGAAAIAAALSWNPLHEEEERRALAEFNAGYALERRGDAAGAEERYAAALALEPRMAEAWLHLGNLSARAGHLAAARARYERAVSLRPRDPRPRANLGLTYLVGTPHPERAIAHVREAARLSPEDSDVAFKLGNAHRAAGDLPAAVAAYERALRLSPALPEAWNNLGTALWALAERARDAAAWARATEALGTAVALGSAHAGRNLERLAERLSRARQPADRR